jgi:hypothetical protein
MSERINPKNNDLDDQQINERAHRGLYVKEDDQDWGSAGMNNIQKDSELNQ